MRKVLAATVAGLMLAFGLALASNPAAASPGGLDKEAVVSLTVTDRDDSGKNGVWAKDTFARNVKVVTSGTYKTAPTEAIQARISEAQSPQVLCDVVAQESLLWEYLATVNDNGTFVTVGNGATASPMGAALVKDVAGSFTGGARASILAPAHWCSFVSRYDGATVSGAAAGSTSEFLGKLFGKDGFKAEPKLTRWGWNYNTKCEGWTNALAGNTGDINGKICAPLVEFTNATCQDAKAYLKVTNPNAHVTLAVAFNGVSKTIAKSGSVTHEFSSGVTLLEARQLRAKNYEYTAAKDCPTESPTPSPSTSSPTPSPSNPGNGGGSTPTATPSETAAPSTSNVADGGELPVTGESNKGKMIATVAIGFLLISIGGILYGVARRRRAVESY